MIVNPTKTTSPSVIQKPSNLPKNGEQVLTNNHIKAHDPSVAIEFKNVSFGYVESVQVIKNISFKIQKSKYVCIVGHNGSGKSTISKILMGLIKPWSGSVEVLGITLNHSNLKRILNRMGLIFQNPDNQFVGLTAQDDIAFGLENRKVPREVIIEIITDVAKEIGITDFLNMDASVLSGGQKQKVAIASVLAINPDIIIFDESTSMLDPKSKEEIKKLMRNLSTIQNKTVISITHDMEELLNADEILVLKNGELIKQSDPKTIFSDPQFILDARLDLPFNSSLAHNLNQLGIQVPSTYEIDLIVAAILSKNKG